MARSTPGKKRRPYPNRVRELRLAAGLTQQQVADGVNLSFQTIGKYERGELRLKVDQLDKFAKALRCQPWEILPGAPSIDSKQRALLDLFEQMSPADQDRYIRLGSALREQFEAELTAG